MHRLHLNRYEEPSGLRAEHLHQWIQEAKREEYTDATHWLKVFAIIQAALRNGTLANNSTRQTVVMIKKGDGGDF